MDLVPIQKGFLPVEVGDEHVRQSSHPVALGHKVPVDVPPALRCRPVRQSVLLAQLFHVLVGLHDAVEFLHQRGVGPDEAEHVSLLAAQQAVVLEYGIGPVYRIEDIHEPCIFPSFGRHQTGHRRVRELPGIALLGDEVHELRILGIDVLKVYPEGVADVLVVCQSQRLASIAHDEPVVADHIVRTAALCLYGLLQLTLYHLRVPSLAGRHPQHAHVGMPEAVARMFRCSLELQVQVLAADGDAVVVDDRVGLLCCLLLHTSLGDSQSALLHPVKNGHVRRDVVGNAVPQEPCQLQDPGNLMGAYPRKGVEQDGEADGYFFVSVSGNSNSATSRSFSESEDRISPLAFFYSRTSVFCSGVLRYYTSLRVSCFFSVPASRPFLAPLILLFCLILPKLCKVFWLNNQA